MYLELLDKNKTNKAKKQEKKHDHVKKSTKED